jgi:ABC-type multidrug transport system fused ATPase/permease subunit
VKYKLKYLFSRTILYKAISLLPNEDRIKIVFVLVIQMFLSVLDLLGVAVLGFIGALSFTGVQSLKPGDKTTELLNYLGIESFSFQTQVAALAATAVVLFIIRTAISIVLLKKCFYFLSRRGAQISTNLFSRLMSSSLITIQERTTQQTLHAITIGVQSITFILGISINLIADLSISIIMIIGLLVVDPLLGLLTILFLGSIGLILYLNTNVKSHRLGFMNKELALSSSENIIEALGSFREIVVKNRRDYFSLELKVNRFKAADVLAELTFMPSYSKYLLEAGIIIGAVTIAGIQFLTKDSQAAIAVLSVFLAASTRIAPAIMRIQQSLIQIKGSIGYISPTFELIDSLKNIDKKELSNQPFSAEHAGFNPQVRFNSVSYTYPENSFPTINDINLTIDEGSMLGIVGPSGSGKTTLVDLLLGILTPNSGNILISNKQPLDSINAWPGAIGYVPQNVVIVNGSIRDNVTFGYPANTISDELILEALNTAQLGEFTSKSAKGLYTEVGERGTKISGGQRQRLGIARALLSKPRLLVLDEATSSLDGQSEFDVSTDLKAMKGKVTLVIIAHRLSTIREADKIIYLSKGRIINSGTFEEVRNNVPDFDSQAKLMGLNQ